MVYYSLIGDNEEAKKAFLEGCRAMMEVYSHSAPSDYGIISSRSDENWILYLCEKEKARERKESAQVAEAILREYRVDYNQIRGLLLGLDRVDKNGNGVDENGKPCAPQPYPHLRYKAKVGTTLTPEEFQKLTPKQQEECITSCYVELRHKVSDAPRLFGAYDRALTDRIVVNFLKDESPEMLEKYHEIILEDRDTIGVLESYADIVEKLLDIHKTVNAATEIAEALYEIYKEGSDDNQEADSSAKSSAEESPETAGGTSSAKKPAFTNERY